VCECVSERAIVSLDVLLLVHLSPVRWRLVSVRYDCEIETESGVLVVYLCALFLHWAIPGKLLYMSCVLVFAVAGTAT
jgi:hypothetical protein